MMLVSTFYLSPFCVVQLQLVSPPCYFSPSSAASFGMHRIRSALKVVTPPFTPHQRIKSVSVTPYFSTSSWESSCKDSNHYFAKESGNSLLSSLASQLSSISSQNIFSSTSCAENSISLQEYSIKSGSRLPSPCFAHQYYF